MHSLVQYDLSCKPVIIILTHVLIHHSQLFFSYHHDYFFQYGPSNIVSFFAFPQREIKGMRIKLPQKN